jgi:HTH-type transcriptional regulator/antitoxin HigA
MPPTKAKARTQAEATAKPRPAPHAKPASLASYHRLVRRFPLVPIRDADHLAEAHAVLEAIADRDYYYDDDEALYVGALASLVGVYEDRHWPADPLPPAEMLRAFMEEAGLSQSQLARETGIGQSTIAELLGGKRKMTLRHIERFAARFRVAPAAFLPPRTAN